MNLWKNFSMTRHGKNFQATFSGRNKCLKSIKVKWIGKRYPIIAVSYGLQLCYKKFKKLIDWEKLSKTDCETILTEDCLEQFKDYWDWAELSDNRDVEFNYQLIDRFIDRWNWHKLINRWSEDKLYNIDFLERYADKIPYCKLQKFSSMGWTCGRTD